MAIPARFETRIAVRHIDAITFGKAIALSPIAGWTLSDPCTLLGWVFHLIADKGPTCILHNNVTGEILVIPPRYQTKDLADDVRKLKAAIARLLDDAALRYDGPMWQTVYARDYEPTNGGHASRRRGATVVEQPDQAGLVLWPSPTPPRARRLDLSLVLSLSLHPEMPE